MLPRLVARSASSARVATLRRSPVPVCTLPSIWSRGMAHDHRNKPGNPKFARPQNPPHTKASNHRPNPRDAQNAGPTSASKPTAEPRQHAPPSTAKTATQPSPPSEASESGPKTSSEPGDSPEPIDISKLPDLMQGIPSTLEYETAHTKEKTALAATNAAKSSDRGGRGKGELPASAYVSSSERRRQRFFRWFFVAAGLQLVLVPVYLGREWDSEEQEKFKDIPNGWGLGLWWRRARARMGSTLTYYQEPAFEKLLPDMTESTYRPYTLVISLEDMLVHNEWSREHGWRVAKRPGMDYFIRYLSQYYEIVMWTSVPFSLGEIVFRKVDPYHFVMYPLFREATKYVDGDLVKDLSYLNRDLSKVIVLDTDPSHVRAQPENAVILPKWTGDLKDRELVAMVPFLEYIATVNYSDVRKVLQSFEGKHIPTEFARREAIARAEFNKKVAAQRGGKVVAPGSESGGGLGVLANVLGMKPSKMSMMVAPEGEENPQEAFAKGKMLQDIARERGQRWYQEMEKQIRENGEQWLKEEAEMMEKANAEAMEAMKGSVTSWLPSWSEKKPTQQNGKPAEN